MARYTRVTVFRDSDGDFTNGGVSSLHTALYVVDPEGQEMKTPPAPNLIFRTEDRGQGYLAMIPIRKQDDKVGPMFGGNLASSLNGPSGSKIYRIHDRFETPEDYQALST
jgi:hypothetical protein